MCMRVSMDIRATNIRIPSSVACGGLTFDRANKPPPTMPVEMAVPTTANSRIEPRFWKKLPCGVANSKSELLTFSIKQYTPHILTQ